LWYEEEESGNGLVGEGGRGRDVVLDQGWRLVVAASLGLRLPRSATSGNSLSSESDDSMRGARGGVCWWWAIVGGQQGEGGDATDFSP
jgi:hypothetical protein